jgi:hypothetical protein
MEPAMKSVLLSALVVLSSVLSPIVHAQPLPAAVTQSALTATPLVLPASLRAEIDQAIAVCGCFSTVTSWQVSPIATSAQVFSSPEIVSAVLGQDFQLPWVASGEISASALPIRLSPSGQKAVLVHIAGYADPSGGGFHLGQYSWSRQTQPDFCSGETLYLMYFERTGALFAFRFDSSHEC